MSPGTWAHLGRRDPGDEGGVEGVGVRGELPKQRPERPAILLSRQGGEQLVLGCPQPAVQVV